MILNTFCYSFKTNKKHNSLLIYFYYLPAVYSVAVFSLMRRAIKKKNPENCSFQNDLNLSTSNQRITSEW